ncbi:MAG: leucyl/phenylalanyl-tRNA--protein transferase [Algiphilus sp.]|uniref:leucyl/phenylalanyl-tRNA--protein transferase n=1 Tax=Algiphilus sp. TaxID=1872431 RepID=UPI0032EF1F9D
MDNPIRLHWLDPKDPAQPFPPAGRALRDPNGLLAIGGDLSSARLLRAYREGIFPWFNPDEPILWWSPDPRTILPTQGMHVSRSLRRAVRRANYAVSFNTAPDAVLEACAAPRAPGQGTWLGLQMRKAYRALFDEGAMKTVEIWREGRLIGGVYGVAIGRMFFGESMFSSADDGSKIALYWLCHFMNACEMPMLDCQVGSPHLQRLGAVDIPRSQFIESVWRLTSLPAPNWKVPEAAPSTLHHYPARSC